MILFGLLHMGEEHTCPFSLSSRNRHTSTSVGWQSVQLALLQFSFFALCMKVYTTYRVLPFVTFGQYSNIDIIYNCVNWLTGGYGQVSRFWEAVAIAELDPRHLFLILWSCVAY